MRNKKVVMVVQASMIAAIYVVLTFVSNVMGLASGSIQVRLSEALCVLPAITVSAIPGLWIGCLLANLLTGCVIWDVIFGSLTTLLGALGVYLFRKKKAIFIWIPVLANMLLIPFVLIYAYGVPEVYVGDVNVTYLFNAITVGVGEFISVCVLGMILYTGVNKYRNFLFRE